MTGPLLFDKADIPRTIKAPRVLGHVIDCGNSDDNEAPTWVRLKCRNGHVWEIVCDYTITQLKRGIPCPACAASPPPPTRETEKNACHGGGVRVIANGHDVTDSMPLTRAELERQRPK